MKLDFFLCFQVIQSAGFDLIIQQIFITSFSFSLTKCAEVDAEAHNM